MRQSFLRNLAMEQRKRGCIDLFRWAKQHCATAQGKEIGDMARQRMDKGKKARPLPQEEVCRCAGKDAQRGHTEYMKDMMEYQYEE